MVYYKSDLKLKQRRKLTELKNEQIFLTVAQIDVKA